MGGRTDLDLEGKGPRHNEACERTWVLTQTGPKFKPYYVVKALAALVRGTVWRRQRQSQMSAMVAKKPRLGQRREVQRQGKRRQWGGCRGLLGKGVPATLKRPKSGGGSR